MFLFSWFSKFLCKLRLFRDYSWVDKCNFHDFLKFTISVFGNENRLVGGVLERIFTWRMHRYHHFFHMTRRLEMVWLWVFAFCGNLAHELLRIKILWHKVLGSFALLHNGIRREIYQNIIWPTSAAVSCRDDILQIYIYYGTNLCLLVSSVIHILKKCTVFHWFWGWVIKKHWRLSEFNENCERKKNSFLHGKNWISHRNNFFAFWKTCALSKSSLKNAYVFQNAKKMLLWLIQFFPWQWFQEKLKISQKSQSMISPFLNRFLIVLGVLKTLFTK